LRKRIAIFASGGGTNLQAVMDACREGAIPGDVALVIYNRKQAYAKVRAEEAGIPTRYINKLMFETPGEKDAAILDALREYGIDIIVLAGYLDIMGPSVVAAYRHRIVNTHPALIPMFCGMGYYGERVHQAAIDYGVKVSGCTIHLVDEGTDTGPILLQEAVPVLPGDDAKTLAARILPVEHRLLPRAVALLCEDRVRVEGRRAYIIDK
jgi:phosphoribosylglycinamide formyltransferase-1